MLTHMPVKNGNGNGATAVVPWIFASMGMLGAVVVFVWGQINPKVDIGNVELRLTGQMADLERRMQSADEQLKKEIDSNKIDLALKLSISTFEEYKMRKDNDTKRQDDQLTRLLQTRANRDELNKDIASVTERMAAQRDAIVKLQEAFGGSYNIGKALDSLQASQVKQQELFQTQMSEIQRRIDMRSTVAPNSSTVHP